MPDEISLDTINSQARYELNVDIRQGELLVAGFSKKIYKAEWLIAESPAIVLIEMRGKNATTEVLLNISLEHRNIVKSFGLVEHAASPEHSQSILLAQEYATDGNLREVLANRTFIPNTPVLNEIFAQISSAMIYLSGQGVMHGDLACRNVLVFESNPAIPQKNLVKLIDFGLTRNSPTISGDFVEIPVRYAAPEILLGKGRSGYSEKSDVYSFAVLIWEAYSTYAMMPYERIPDDEEVSRRKLKGEKLEKPKNCDDATWKLMLQCWMDQPDDRPTFQEIHSAIQNMGNSRSILPTS